jgi:pyruvate/2-oxoglutarate dehydrogenase complex dihydrolipoamide acyltransferase (E2) component
MLISPLAARLCKKKGIDPAVLRGSGPRGRIMAADVVEPTTAPVSRGCTVVNDFATPPTRPEIDGYYVYDHEVNMAALARISLPIAVQCEKLLEKRYSLFDYIVRAVVKACTSHPVWMPADGKVDVLLFEDAGNKVVAIENAATKSIYRLARETQRPSSDIPAGFYPHIAVCDTLTARQQVAEHVVGGQLPAFGFVVRGKTPKVGIRAGGDALSTFSLPYTFYISTTIPAAEANRIAARLSDLLYNPVSLLLPT